MPDSNATPPIRLGYHGSPLVATRLSRLAGLTEHDVELVAYDVVDPFRALLAGELDVMIAKFTLDEPALRWSRTLAYEPRAVVVHANHPLAAHDAVSIEEAAAYDVFDRPGVFPAYIWDAVVPRRTPGGRELRRRHRAATVAEMMALVASSDAIHISLGSLADIAPPSIRIVPIYDLPAAPVTLAWKRDTELPPHVRRFIEASQVAATDVGTLRVPVALLHAPPLQVSMWRAQERELTALGVPVIAFDYRGSGRSSPGNAAPSLDVIADDLVRALDARKLDRIVVVGSSMAGYVAMAFLRRHPDRVAGLALLAARATADAPAAGTDREQLTAILEEAQRAASALPRGRLIRILDAGHLPPLETPEVVTSALVELLREVNQAEAARR